MLEMFGNFPYYLLYFVVDLLMVIVAGFIYMWVTPYNEIQLIKNRNSAAAIALGGAAIGFSLVIYTTTVHGIGILQTVGWSAVALVVQLVAFQIVRLLIRDDWKVQIEGGSIAHGVTLAWFSLLIGMINAACLHP